MRDVACSFLTRFADATRPQATHREGSSMFSAYMIAQNKLQNVECRKRTKTSSFNDSSMQRSRGHMHDANGSSLHDANGSSMHDANGSSLPSASATKPSSAESLLFHDEDGEDDCASGSENDDDGGVYLEASAAAARSTQYRGRRAPVQDALIHRFVPHLTSTSIFPAMPCFMKANDRTAMREAVDGMKTNDDGIEKLLELELAYISVRFISKTCEHS
jgi:hypothetical protein